MNIIVSQSEFSSHNYKNDSISFFRSLMHAQHGIKCRSSKDDKLAPHHSPTNKKYVATVNAGKTVKGMTDQDFADHAASKETFYYVNSPSASTEYVCIMIDIDCHDGVGTKNGCIDFALHLRDTFFPGLYFEPSTNGQGIHAYVLAARNGANALVVKDAMRRLQSVLLAEKRRIDADIQIVEIKGMPPIVEYDEADELIVKYKAGTLAKIPRNLDGLKFTAVLDIEDLENNDIFPLPEGSEKLNKKELRKFGSNNYRFCPITPEMAANPLYQQRATQLMDLQNFACKGRERVSVECLAHYLVVLDAARQNMNEDGSLPYAQLKRMWTDAYADGIFSIAWSDKRNKAMRDGLSKLGLVVWTDNQYVVGHYVDEDGVIIDWRDDRLKVKSLRDKFTYEKGAACKWQPHEALFDESITLIEFIACSSSQNFKTPSSNELIASYSPQTIETPVSNDLVHSSSPIMNESPPQLAEKEEAIVTGTHINTMKTQKVLFVQYDPNWLAPVRLMSHPMVWVDPYATPEWDCAEAA